MTAGAVGVEQLLRCRVLRGHRSRVELDSRGALTAGEDQRQEDRPEPPRRSHRSSTASSSRAATIMSRTRALRAGISAGVRPVVSTGSSTRTVARERANRQSCLRQGRLRPVHGERQDRHAGVDREPERAILERQQLRRWWTGCPRGKSSPTPCSRAPRGIGSIASTALGPKPRFTGTSPASCISHPMHRHAEELGLGQPLHLPRQMADQQDVHERFVVRHDHVGSPGVRRHCARGAEPPKRIERGGDAARLPEQIADRIAAPIERRRHEADDAT